MNTFVLMDIFPVDYSSLSAKALLELVTYRYALSGDTTIAFLKRGFNDTYLLCSGEVKFILRVYKHNWRSLEGVQSELELLLLLKSNGIRVSFPVHDTKSNLIQTIQAPEGVRYSVLFSYAEGKPVKKLSSEQAFLLGIASANMHLLTKNIKLNTTGRAYTISGQFSHTLAVLQPILNDYPGQFQYLKQLEQRFLKEFEQDDELVCGICHGDLQSENFHITADNQFTFFDFDFFGKGYLVYDIGVFMWYDHKNKPPEIMNAFLKGYESKRKLSEAERRAIPWLSTLRAIFQMTLYCELSDGKQLPLWPARQIADFIDKVEKWVSTRIPSPKGEGI